MHSNLFSNHYTVESCQETCAYDYMMKKCGDVVDVWKRFRSANGKPLNNSKHADSTCLHNATDLMRLSASATCTCQKPCEETTYSASEKLFDFEARWTTRNHGLTLRLYKDKAVTAEKIMADFPPEMFLGTFGGVLGLGGKFQAVFQFIVFLFLCISHIFRR